MKEVRVYSEMLEISWSSEAIRRGGKVVERLFFKVMENVFLS